MALHPRRSDMSFMDPYFDEFSLIPRIMNEMEMKTMPHHGVHPNSMTQFAPLLSADLVESETDFHIHADLPGVSKEDLDISFEEGKMTIKAERKEVFESNSVFHKAHTIERNFGKVQRSVRIPKNVDADKVQATLKDGVLEIILPKLVSSSEKVKKIMISETKA